MISMRAFGLSALLLISSSQAAEKELLWVHGTTSRALPLLSKTKQLMSSGLLLDREGLAPMSGELSHGMFTDGISQLFLSVHVPENTPISWIEYANRSSPLHDHKTENFLNRLHQLEITPLDHPDWDRHLLSLFRFKQCEPHLFLEHIELFSDRLEQMKKALYFSCSKERYLLFPLIPYRSPINSCELIPHRLESRRGKQLAYQSVPLRRALRFHRLVNEQPKVFLSEFDRELLDLSFPILFASTVQRAHQFHEDEGNLLFSTLGQDVDCAYVLPEHQNFFIRWLEENELKIELIDEKSFSTLVQEIP